MARRMFKLGHSFTLPDLLVDRPRFGTKAQVQVENFIGHILHEQLGCHCLMVTQTTRDMGTGVVNSFVRGLEIEPARDPLRLRAGILKIGLIVRDYAACRRYRRQELAIVSQPEPK